MSAEVGRYEVYEHRFDRLIRVMFPVGAAAVVSSFAGEFMEVQMLTLLAWVLFAAVVALGAAVLVCAVQAARESERAEPDAFG